MQFVGLDTTKCWNFKPSAVTFETRLGTRGLRFQETAF